MTIGSTREKPWMEALTTERERGAPFTGRTFSRFHMLGDGEAPTVGEIWATGDHAVEAHAHEVDELFYVLSGAIEIDGRAIRENDVAFIPKGTAYSARVTAPGGSRVLRIALPGLPLGGPQEYDGRVWTGPLTESGVPRIDPSTAP